MIPTVNSFSLSTNSSNLCFTLEAVADDIVEMDETFSFSLLFDNALDRVQGDDSVTVYIIDDDGEEREILIISHAPIC